MAFDVSYHPIDQRLVQGRLLPFIQGEGSILDLVDRASRITEVRAEAKAWGLALAGAPRPELHVWGRPFFIVGDTPAEVAAGYDRFLEAEPGDVAALVAEMAARIGVTCTGRELNGTPELTVAPGRLAAELSWRLDLMRDAYAAYNMEVPVHVAENLDVHPIDLLASELGTTLLSFISSLQPAWITQGYAWPTFLFRQSGFGVPAVFESAYELLSPLLADLPELDGLCGTTLGDGQQIGGYVRAENVPVLADALNEAREEILDWAGEDGWREECELDLAKLTEAVHYAERKGLAFLEASHLYSAAFGVLN